MTTVTFSEDIYEDGNDYDVSCKFTFVSGEMTASMYCSQFGITPKNWLELILAVKKNSQYDLNFLNSNGCIDIGTNNGFTKFEMSRFSCDNDGKICITVPNNSCIEALEKAYDSCLKSYSKN